MTKRKAKEPRAAQPPPRTHTIEGFAGPNAEEVLRGVHLGTVPSMVNWPAIHRVRVTAEVIDEPDEVLAARLAELWETSPYNYHHSAWFSELAARYGAVLEYSRRACRAPKERR